MIAVGASAWRHSARVGTPITRIAPQDGRRTYGVPKNVGTSLARTLPHSEFRSLLRAYSLISYPHYPMARS
eukprot:2352863-Pyramimonas_sp.AAC.1